MRSRGPAGIFVGGGGSVRLPRLIGVSRMMEMMLTGRTYGAEEGTALGFSHYVVDDGQGLAKGMELARKIASNSQLTNYAVMQVLPRIAETGTAPGYMFEALMAAIAQADNEAKARTACLEKRAAKAVHDRRQIRLPGGTRLKKRRKQGAQTGRTADERVCVYSDRDVRLGEASIEVEHRADGATTGAAGRPLPPYAAKVAEPARTLAGEAPDRLFFAKRGPRRRLARAHLCDAVPRSALARRGRLIERGLSAERPVLVLSGNDLEHLLLNLGLLFTRAFPIVPVSPSYALLSADFGDFKHIVAQTTPGLVFASDGAACRARRFEAAIPSDGGGSRSRSIRRRTARVTLFEDLLSTTAGPETDAANAAVGPDTVAQDPIHLRLDRAFRRASSRRSGMLTATRKCCWDRRSRFFGVEPLVVCDWLPWNHTFGGSHNFGLVLYNGGTFYLDDGRPVPGAIDETIRNLREIAPTVYFNVPKGYEMLVPHLEGDPELRQRSTRVCG